MIFNLIDRNHDGFIDKGELTTIFGGYDVTNNVMKEKKKFSLNDFKELMFELFENSKNQE